MSARDLLAGYVAGRVQVFDSTGTFLTQWSADPSMPLRDLAADRGGTVYVVQSAEKDDQALLEKAKEDLDKAIKYGFDRRPQDGRRRRGEPAPPDRAARSFPLQ